MKVDGLDSNLATLMREIEMEMENLKLRQIDTMTRREDRLQKLLVDLRNKRDVTDFRFDQVYSEEIRDLSETHWTPVQVAIKAAEMLVTSPRTRVLDVGSGCGKFCLIGALTGPGHFIGVEQRPFLVEIARSTADRLNATGVSFIQGNMVDIDWSYFDAFYLYNPFYEQIVQSILIDDTISPSPAKFKRYVQVVQTKLRDLRDGTRVVTYHGLGGAMPEGFQLLKEVPCGTHVLELWVKDDAQMLIPKR